MFSSPRALFTPRNQEPPRHPDIPPLLAAELAQEYASLGAARNCPRGMYLSPSEETILKWHGVFFVHKGPYSGAVLRFSIVFPLNYPSDRPIIRFTNDVFHPMVDPKSRIWYPSGHPRQRKPQLDHVPQLLHNLKASFKTKALEQVHEDDAVNKHVWSLYHHSHQTFLSMTAQRAAYTASETTLYPDAHPLPPSPTRKTSTPTRQRQTSMNSLASDDGLGPTREIIKFKEFNEGEKEALWAMLKGNFGDELSR
ncbi:hypothetical protein B9479_005220 [Cryptococcus floricola]|uniref:UBC core domain-containing protein n=1 Tax=Cryptococcus floricola TaxID=2591691 RepID=A0A5D3ATI4_9TREE|nr:hypothetical protein B9479_005220 [Cryptococcus floricola]